MILTNVSYRDKLSCFTIRTYCDYFNYKAKLFIFSVHRLTRTLAAGGRTLAIKMTWKKKAVSVVKFIQNILIRQVKQCFVSTHKKQTNWKNTFLSTPFWEWIFFYLQISFDFYLASNFVRHPGEDFSGGVRRWTENIKSLA